MREFILLLIGLWIGGFVGVGVMCLMQVDRCQRCPRR